MQAEAKRLQEEYAKAQEIAQIQQKKYGEMLEKWKNRINAKISYCRNLKSKANIMTKY